MPMSQHQLPRPGTRTNPIEISNSKSRNTRNNKDDVAHENTATSPHGPFHWVTDSEKREALKDLIARCPFGVDGTAEHMNIDAVTHEAFNDDDVTAQDIRTKVRALSTGHCFFMSTLEDLYNRSDWRCPVTRKPFTHADLQMIRAYIEAKDPPQAHHVSWAGYDARQTMSNNIYRLMGLLGAQHPAFRIQNLHLQTVRGDGVPAGWPQEPEWVRGSPAGATVDKTVVSFGAKLKVQIRPKGRRGAQPVTVVELATGLRGNLVASMVKKMASRVRTVRELYTLVCAIKRGQVAALTLDATDSFWYLRQLYRFICESATVIESRP